MDQTANDMFVDKKVKHIFRHFTNREVSSEPNGLKMQIQQRNWPTKQLLNIRFHRYLGVVFKTSFSK